MALSCGSVMTGQTANDNAHPLERLRVLSEERGFCLYTFMKELDARDISPSRLLPDRSGWALSPPMEALLIALGGMP